MQPSSNMILQALLYAVAYHQLQQNHKHALWYCSSCSGRKSERQLLPQSSVPSVPAA